MMILMMMMMMRLALLYYFPSLPALCLRLCALNAPVKFNYNSVHRCDYSHLLSAQKSCFPSASVCFGALHWCMAESGCLGDRSIDPRGSQMIGRNIPLILSRLPCLLHWTVQMRRDRVALFSSCRG